MYGTIYNFSHDIYILIENSFFFQDYDANACMYGLKKNHHAGCDLDATLS